MRVYSRATTAVLTVVMALSLLATPACHRKVVVTNTPAGVSSNTVANWYTAAGAFELAAKYTQQLTDAAISLHSEFPDEATYQKTLGALGNMAQIEVQAANYLDTVPQNWNQNVAQQVAAYANNMALQVSVALDDGLAHVKNPNKISTLQTTMGLLRGVIKTVAALV